MCGKKFLLACGCDAVAVGGSRVSKVALAALLFGSGAITAATTEQVPGEAVVSPAAVDVANAVAGESVEQASDLPRLPMTVTQRPLAEVLAEITQLSGIRFTLTPSLRDHKIDAILEGSDWGNAVKEFLQNYNHLAIIGADGGLRRVWVLGFGDAIVNQSCPRMVSDDQGDEQPFLRRPDERLDTLVSDTLAAFPSKAAQHPGGGRVHRG